MKARTGVLWVRFIAFVLSLAFLGIGTFSIILVGSSFPWVPWAFFTVVSIIIWGSTFLGDLK